MNRFYQIGSTLVLALFFLTGVVVAEGDWIFTDKGYKVWENFPMTNESVTWTGSADAERYASGQGVLQWFRSGNPGRKYEGNLLKGKADGKGVYTSEYDIHHGWGFRYEGAWVDGKENGKGVYTYVNGRRYEGDVVNGMMNGKVKSATGYSRNRLCNTVPICS